MRGCVVSALMMLAPTTYFYFSYSRDTRLLRMAAAHLTATITTRDDKVRVLTSFVYHNKGFNKNRGYYLLKALGATPLQILEKGGDCSDKSRLLSAMLGQIGIKSSLAMLCRCQGCVPVHTVVLAETESGTIVADPTYDLMFPKQSVGYHDVREMIGDPGILIDRLRVLRSVWGLQDKISEYEEESHRYDFVTTVNWSKYSWLKVLSSTLRKLGLERPLYSQTGCT